MVCEALLSRWPERQHQRREGYKSFFVRSVQLHSPLALDLTKLDGFRSAFGHDLHLSFDRTIRERLLTDDSHGGNGLGRFEEIFRRIVNRSLQGLANFRRQRSKQIGNVVVSQSAKEGLDCVFRRVHTHPLSLRRADISGGERAVGAASGELNIELIVLCPQRRQLTLTYR